MTTIRNSAKAVIVHDGRLLVVEHRSPGGETYFTLPGGGQEHGEALDAAVARECREELGADVHVGDLLCVRDYISRDHEFAAEEADVHQVEFMFECSLFDRSQVGRGTLPDANQVGVRWVPLAELCASPLYPKALRSWLAEHTARPRYLGNVN